MSELAFKPPQGVADAAQRGLDLRAEQSPSQRGGTAVGVARARDLANRRDVSLDTIGRIVSYFARHSVDVGKPGWSPGHPNYPSKGRQAWLLWGGDPGKRWAEDIWARHKEKHETEKSERATLWTDVL